MPIYPSVSILSLPTPVSVFVCICVHVRVLRSNEILKVNQNSRVMDYMSMLCHMQLTQIDCTVHYSVSAWKINKYGGNRPQLSTFPSDSSRSETDHTTVMCTPQLRQAGGA